MSFIDYVHVITKFLVSNGKNIYKIRKNNSYHNSVISHNPDKVIFNFSSHALNTTEKSLLSKGFRDTSQEYKSR